MSARRLHLRDRIALALLTLALAVRVLVPAGWMPAQQGQGFAIAICSGSGTESVWIDSAGKVHKQAPAPMDGEHCAFAGLAAPMLGSDLPSPFVPALRTGEAPAPHPALASIGQGLAAPPPPATGPPATV